VPDGTGSRSTSPAQPSYNEEKCLAYDALLGGWALARPRYAYSGPSRSPSSYPHASALGYAQRADRLMTGRIGAMGSPPPEWWYYAAATRSSSPPNPTSATNRSPCLRSTTPSDGAPGPSGERSTPTRACCPRPHLTPGRRSVDPHVRRPVRDS
jgi:hypothetical protein